jgi:ADP-ribosylglycohydrolase
METLIMCVLGDIIGVTNNEYRKENFKRITKNTYGETIIKEGLSRISQHYIEYIASGGTYHYIERDNSYLSDLLYVTLKNIDNINIKKEYIKILKSDSINNTNDSATITRIIPYGLIYSKKNEVSKLIKEISENIRLTNNNNTTCLGAITLGLFISYAMQDIPINHWGYKMIDYISDIKIDNIDFTSKEDYISLWKDYLTRMFKKPYGTYRGEYFVKPIKTALIYYYIKENPNQFIYGLNADDAMIIAYDSLLNCDGHWQTIVLSGVLGITDCAVMGMICGALYGAVYKNADLQINKYVNEDWVKKTIKLGKNLNI